MAYASYAEYVDNGGTLPEEEALKALKHASDCIDIMTFTRVNVLGFDNLKPFQQDRIKEVCCELADFQTEYADLVVSPISGYSINGVSVTFNGNNTITNAEGVLIPTTMYMKLVATGLCCGVI